MTHLLNKLFFIIAILLFIGGCKNENACNEYNQERQNYLGLKFYSLFKSNGIFKTGDTTLAQITIVNADTTLKSKNYLTLPLSQARDTSRYSLIINDHPESLLTIICKRNRVFISYNCGFRTDFEIDTIYFEPNLFDSIKIIQPIVTDPYEENIKLYFNRPVASGNP